jgi:hypothetical protein
MTTNKGTSLEVALYRYPRIISQDAGGADVIIERFLMTFTKQDIIWEVGVLENSVFSLVVIRNSVIEESMLCHGYAELVHDLIKHVHGGSALARQEEWHSIDDAPIVHQGNLASLVCDGYVSITSKLTELEDLVLQQMATGDRLPADLALKYLAGIRKIVGNLYQNAGGQ